MIRRISHTWFLWKTRDRSPVDNPLYVLRLIRWFFQQVVKWAFLALGLVFFLLGGVFAIENPFWGHIRDAALLHDTRSAPRGSWVMCVCFLLIDWFLVNHFLLLHRKARPRDG